MAISEAEKVVEAFKVNFRDEWLAMMQRKLGLIGNDDGDQQLIWDLLEWMSSSGADYTNTFYLLSNFNILSHSFYNKPQFLSWYERWESRLQRIEVNQSEAQNMMKKYNPVYIPRNHKVEEALDAAEDKGDFSILENFLNVLSQPYEETSGDSSFMEPRPDGMSDYKTYCGT